MSGAAADAEVDPALLKAHAGFEASTKWEGAREGKLFKAGVHGVGYYPDLYGEIYAKMVKGRAAEVSGGDCDVCRAGV